MSGDVDTSQLMRISVISAQSLWLLVKRESNFVKGCFIIFMILVGTWQGEPQGYLVVSDQFDCH